MPSSLVTLCVIVRRPGEEVKLSNRESTDSVAGQEMSVSSTTTKWRDEWLIERLDMTQANRSSYVSWQPIASRRLSINSHCSSWMTDLHTIIREEENLINKDSVAEERVAQSIQDNCDSGEPYRINLSNYIIKLLIIIITVGDTNNVGEEEEQLLHAHSPTTLAANKWKEGEKGESYERPDCGDQSFGQVISGNNDLPSNYAIHLIASFR